MVCFSSLLLEGYTLAASLAGSPHRPGLVPAVPQRRSPDPSRFISRASLPGFPTTTCMRVQVQLRLHIFPAAGAVYARLCCVLAESSASTQRHANSGQRMPADFGDFQLGRSARAPSIVRWPSVTDSSKPAFQTSTVQSAMLIQRVVRSHAGVVRGHAGVVRSHSGRFYPAVPAHSFDSSRGPKLSSLNDILTQQTASTPAQHREANIVNEN